MQQDDNDHSEWEPDNRRQFQHKVCHRQELLCCCGPGWKS